MEKNFIFLRLPVLREYLERELVMPNLPFPYDLERAIDDWVHFLGYLILDQWREKSNDVKKNFPQK
jgi:5'-3' exoribonuclease 2